MSYKSFAPPPASASTTKLYLYAGLAFFMVPVLSALAASCAYCPTSDISGSDEWVSAVCSDKHYRYLVPLLVPVTAWFAIANWVGWEYFRFS